MKSKFLVSILAILIVAASVALAADSQKEEKNGAEDNDKINICHMPPGNSENPQNISVSEEAWERGHDPHNAHKLDFAIDGDHSCPPSLDQNPPPAHEIPEFPTIALPIAFTIGLVYLTNRQKK